MLHVDMPRQSSSKKRYTPPVDRGQSTLRELLHRSGRADLEQKQYDFLDQAPKGQRTGGLNIYYAGNIGLIEKPSISVIGTRKVTDVGRKRAHKFARELAEAGVVVVSGLADGVDTHALSSAVRAGGEVIAVIGTPLDSAYPAKNAELQEEIYSNHLLISQFADGERVYPSNFPARNRTMAALSDASVIIEASESSGTLHQAAECVRLGRWLGISKSVAEDPALEWPSRFLEYNRCVVLESTEEFLAKIYPE